jgi:hypothetical protein
MRPLENVMNESIKSVPKSVRLKLKYPRPFLGRREELSLDIACPRGWSLLVQDLFTRLDTLLTDDQAQAFQIEQIEEKYGTLRDYYSWAGSPATLTVDVQMPGGERLRFKQAASAPWAYPSDAVDKLIAEAERQSAIPAFSAAARAPSATTDGSTWLAMHAKRSVATRMSQTLSGEPMAKQ